MLAARDAAIVHKSTESDEFKSHVDIMALFYGKFGQTWISKVKYADSDSLFLETVAVPPQMGDAGEHEFFVQLVGTIAKMQDAQTPSLARLKPIPFFLTSNPHPENDGAIGLAPIVNAITRSETFTKFEKARFTDVILPHIAKYATATPNGCVVFDLLGNRYDRGLLRQIVSETPHASQIDALLRATHERMVQMIAQQYPWHDVAAFVHMSLYAIAPLMCYNMELARAMCNMLLVAQGMYPILPMPEYYGAVFADLDNRDVCNNPHDWADAVRYGSLSTLIARMARFSMCWYCASPRRPPSDAETKEETSKALFKCVQCGLVSYCSKECQKHDWKEHKAFCKANAVKEKKEADLDCCPCGGEPDDMETDGQ